MNSRRFLIIVLSPLWLTLALLGLVVGLAVFSGSDPALSLATAMYSGTAEGEQIAYLLARVFILPFQLIFIALVVGAALWVFRRRNAVGRWVLGDPMADRLLATELLPGELPSVLQPSRRRTMQQILSSSIAILAFTTATLLILGQFIAREDLAVAIAALTSSLAWGARLPVGDFLGGISNIFESNLAVGDRIQYPLLDKPIDGIIEAVDLRFMSIRALSGELTTIPFGELRVFRNFSRGDHIAVYAVFPIAARDLGQAVSLLVDLAPESVALVPILVEPWQPMSLDGELGAVVDLCLFGKTIREYEDDLQLALHALVQERFAAVGIHLGGKESKRE